MKWQLTEAGVAALRDWVLSPASVTMLRNELPIRLMFADRFSIGAMSSTVQERRRSLVELRAVGSKIVPDQQREVTDDVAGIVGPSFVQQFGLDFPDHVHRVL